MIRSTVSVCVASSASSSRPPPATRLSAPSGRPAATAASAAIWASTALECAAERGAAQDDRVARLQAQRRGVDRHVRARLVDDRDDAERHAHLAHVQAVRQATALDHLADRVGERGDLADRAARSRRCARSSRRRRSSSAVADAPPRAPACMSRSLASRISSTRRSQRLGDRLERRVLDARCRARELARRALGGAADLRDGRDGGGHGHKGYDGQSSTR